MTVRLYEWDKTETGWAWIEITDNKVVNLKLRDENNLIKINEDDEAYVDLQLPDGFPGDWVLPVWVVTWRGLVADWRPVNGTIVAAKTTSGDVVIIFYWDDWTIWVTNWNGSPKTLWFTTAYFKTQAEYNALPASKTSDDNLYIIVDTHVQLMSYAEICALSCSNAVLELNTAAEAYWRKFSSEWHIHNGFLSDDGTTTRTWPETGSYGVHPSIAINNQTWEEIRPSI